uniref:Uncharacterized protein n=1 Tax=Anguilla anguilla TaxID=7936 RepID=A0A0E9TN18_ANGAN
MTQSSRVPLVFQSSCLLSRGR